MQLFFAVKCIVEAASGGSGTSVWKCLPLLFVQTHN